jgi:hypothetical protein
MTRAVTMPLPDTVLAAYSAEFRKAKRMADRAFGQLRDDDFFVKLNPQQNSIAAYVQHLSGNLRSRFTDFLTTDGEKPDRDREREFADATAPRAQLIAAWEAGWAHLFSTLDSLRPGDLERTITIRNEPHSVPLALARALAHCGYHIGQIVLLAKHIKTSRGEPWDYLTIPPGGSRAFNESKGVPPPSP